MLTLILALIIPILIILKNRHSILRFWQRRQHQLKCLAPIPGPPSIPILGSAHLFKWDNEEFTYQIEWWAREYVQKEHENFPRTGVMKIWIGPIPVVVLAVCDSAKAVLESSTLITKPTQYNTLKKWIGEGLLISTGKKWYSRRKMITPTFHFTILQGFHEIFIFVDVLAPKAETGEVFDIFPLIKMCALDIICETAMGSHIDAQLGKNSDYVWSVVRISQLIWDHERFPWLWLSPIWYASGMGFEFDRLVKLSTDFTRRIIRERREALEAEGLLDKLKNMSPEEIKKNKFSFLDLLLGMQSAQSLSDEDIREEVDTFMFEGHDTTSSGMGFTLWWLGQEFDYQQKVHDELDEVFGDSDRSVTPDDVKKLTYLEMVIKESLRMCSPVPMIGRTLDHDVEINNFTVPEGCTVLISALSAGRDDRHWEHPDVFYPDHFKPECMAKRDPYAFMPFSAGPRNCIGQKFALTEEKIVLATLLRRYRFITLDPYPTNRFLPEIILKPSNGFKVKIQPRQPKVNA